MAERDPSSPERTDGTLLGVPAPRVDATPDSALRKPVFVRAGTSTSENEEEPPPLPRMALPSRPLLPQPGNAESPIGVTSALGSGPAARAKEALRRYPALWMVGVPVLASSLVIGAVVAATAAAPAPVAKGASPHASALPQAAAAAPSDPATTRLAELEGKPAESLSAAELITLSLARSERKLSEARALRRKVEQSPPVAADKAVQADLLRLAGDAETAREALAAMAKAPSPLAADLLYEVWTGTSERTEVTELARAMVYSTDVRSSASPALTVALALRTAQGCDEVRAILPAALKDGDRRALHLLTKLLSKRGCGPKKTDDCYACLREQQQELLATINAVKVRRSPALPTPGSSKLNAP